MSNRILHFPDLQRLCVPKGPPPRASKVRRWADRQHIRYSHDGAGGIWTTVDALNAALGLAPLVDQVGQERPEDLI